MCEPSPRARQAPLTDPGGGPSLRERGRDMRNLRYADVLGLLEAGAILGYLSRKAPSRIGDAVYYRATPEDAPPDAQAPVTSRRTLHLRAGLAALGPGGANDGQKSSPFARLARPPNGTHSARRTSIESVAAALGSRTARGSGQPETQPKGAEPPGSAPFRRISPSEPLCLSRGTGWRRTCRHRPGWRPRRWSCR